jgi:hypothetical protein
MAGEILYIDLFHLICLPQLIYTIDHLVHQIRLYLKCKSKFTVSSKFKYNKNAYHENIDFYNITHMRHRHFGRSMNKYGKLKFISPPKLADHIFSLLRTLNSFSCCRHLEKIVKNY